MSDDKNKVEDMKNMTPEKMLQSIETEVKQSKIKAFRAQFKELVEKRDKAQKVYESVLGEIADLGKELKTVL
jgi:soluble cytochrome b562